VFDDVCLSRERTTNDFCILSVIIVLQGRGTVVAVENHQYSPTIELNGTMMHADDGY
jgi:hypothetical protein